MARPRNPTEGPSATARSRSSQEAIIAAGGRRLLVVLSPEASAALEAIRAAGESAKSAIERALIKAAGTRQGGMR